MSIKILHSSCLSGVNYKFQGDQMVLTDEFFKNNPAKNMEGIIELENRFTTLMKQIHTIVINRFLREKITGSFITEASGCYHVGRQSNGTSPQMSTS